MRREWELEDLIECWTLDEAEFGLLANKSGATRLGFAALLKFYEIEGRFPAYPEEVPGGSHASESVAIWGRHVSLRPPEAAEEHPR